MISDGDNVDREEWLELEGFKGGDPREWPRDLRV